MTSRLGLWCYRTDTCRARTFSICGDQKQSFRRATRCTYFNLPQWLRRAWSGASICCIVTMSIWIANYHSLFTSVLKSPSWELPIRNIFIVQSLDALSIFVYFTIKFNVKKQRRFDRSTVILKLKSETFLKILTKTLKYLHRNNANTQKKNCGMNN